MCRAGEVADTSFNGDELLKCVLSEFGKDRSSPISLFGILLTNGLVFFENRFYVGSTDTRCVGLNLQLCVPYTRGFLFLIRFWIENSGSPSK